MKPPYEITSKILALISKISELIGEIKSARLIKPSTELRKKNRIKTIQSSLEIEGNTLSIEQITDILNKKRVIAPKKDIIEVQNAIKAYDLFLTFKTFSVKSLLSAHKIMMNELITDAGQFRKTQVGIMIGDKIKHLAPPNHMVPDLINSLFDYIKNDDEILLIKGCVFHYEFEFIHPFSDGNGRIGRLWHSKILNEYSPVFEFLPIETIIKQKQNEYYDVLGRSDNNGSSTLFIEFMLQIILDSLEDILKSQNITNEGKDRIIIFKQIFGKSEFSRQDYLRHNKDISTATASRDLKNAVVEKILTKFGDKRMTKYIFN